MLLCRSLRISPLIPLWLSFEQSVNFFPCPLFSYLTASSPSGFTLQSSDSAVVRRSSREPFPAFTP